MAFTTGTATDYHDLLDQLRLYLVAEGWTELDWTPPASITDTAELHMRGPGADVDKQVFVSFRTDYRASDNSYAWKMRGATDYIAGASWGMQPNTSPEVFINLWPNTIDYWFYVNDRRFIVIAKIGVVYVPLYAGFFLPFALPDEHPFPLYIAGNMNALQPFNYGQSHSRFFVDPGNNSAYFMRRVSLTWQALRNHATGTDLDNVFAENSAIIWPMRFASRVDGADTFLNLFENVHFQNLRPNLSGEMPMITPHIMDTYDRTLVGALDGVMVTGGFNRVPEQVVTVGADNYRLFPNVFRSRPRDFMAILEA